MLGLRIRENQRVVGDRVELDIEHALGLLHRIAHGAMHLRDAAQRIAVLRLVLLAAAERAEALIELLAAMALAERHPVPANVEAELPCFRAIPGRRQPLPELGHQVVGDIGQGRAVQQRAQIPCDAHLPRMRAQCMHFRRECTQATCERVNGHCCGKVGGVQQFVQLVQRQHTGRQHLRGTVVERQAFLVGQA